MSPYGDPFTYCPDCGQPIVGVGQHGYGICVVPMDRHDLNESLRLAYLNVRQALIDSGYSEGNLHPVASAALASLEHLYAVAERHTSDPWHDSSGPPGMVGG